MQTSCSVSGTSVYHSPPGRRLGVPTPQPPHNRKETTLTASADTDLTPREATLYEYVGLGWSDKQIAEALGIHVQTVKNTLASVRKKKRATGHATRAFVRNAVLDSLR